MSFDLRDYQQEAVTRVLEAYRVCPNGTELLVLPTGAGKTVVFATIIDFLAREYGAIGLVVAHRNELLEQARNKYREVKPSAVVGKIGGGTFEYGYEVSVCGVATISKPNHLKKLKALYGDGSDLIIVVDESHHVAAAGYKTVLDAFPHAFKLLVTATPDRLDGKPIIDKKPLYECYIMDMIQRGYLCNVKAIAIKTDIDLSNVKTSMGDFDTRGLDLAINTPARNQRLVEAYQEHTPGQAAIVFCVTVAHAEAVTYAFNDAGIKAACVSGDTPMEQRQAIYDALHSGDVQVVCNVNVLTEGFDEPAINVVMMARPTKSRSLYVQSVGRGLRLYPGKTHCTILDITDNCMKHRLQPVSLRSMLRPEMHDGETVLDSLARQEEEKREEEERRQEMRSRKLPERRPRDIIIDLLAPLEWQEKENGLFVMEVGPQKDRIAIVPTPGMDGVYDVCARFAPDFTFQSWLKAQPFELCQEMADKRARLIASGHREWCNQKDPHRQGKATEKQIKMLKWHKVAFQDDITSAQATDLIDIAVIKKEMKAAAREARNQERREA